MHGSRATACHVSTAQTTRAAAAEQPTGFWKKSRISNQVSSPTSSCHHLEVTNVVHDKWPCVMQKDYFRGFAMPILSSYYSNFNPTYYCITDWCFCTIHLHIVLLYLRADSFISLTVQCICSSYYATLPTTHQSNLLAKKSRYMLC